MISSQRGGLGSVGTVMQYHADTMDYTFTQEGLKNELTASEWYGKGAELAGLSGAFEYDALKAALEGKVGKEQVPSGWDKAANEPKHLPGWDYTFSPGRSVSYVALVSGDDRIIAAHVVAVKTALAYAESNGVTMRAYEEDKRIQRTGDNLTVGMAHHIVNRANEPHLHTHALIMNLVHDGIDDKWRALDIQKIEQRRVTQDLDHVYQTSLARNLELLGYSVTQTPADGSKYGIEIEGVPRDLMLNFSQRRYGPDGLEANLAKKGISLEKATYWDKQIANFETRKEKALVRDDLPVMARSDYQEMWRAMSLGWGVEPTQFSLKMVELPSLRLTPAPAADIENAVLKVIDRMHDAKDDVRKLTSALLAVREGQDATRLKVVTNELQQARMELQPKSIEAIARAVRNEPGLQFATSNQVKDVVAKMSADHWLHAHGKDKFSIETPRALQQRTEMDQAADRGYLQFQSNMAMAEAIYALSMGPTRAEFHAARAAAAYEKGDRDTFLLEADRMRDSRPFISQSSLVNAIRAEVPHVTSEATVRSLVRAHAAGTLTTIEGQGLSMESHAQIKDRTELQQLAVNAALDIILERQAKNLDRVAALTEALGKAVKEERAQALLVTAGNHANKAQPAPAVAVSEEINLSPAAVKDSLKLALEGSFSSVEAIASAAHAALRDKDVSLANAVANAISEGAAEKGLAPKEVQRYLQDVLDYQAGKPAQLAGAIERKFEGRQTAAELSNELRLVSGQVAQLKNHWADLLKDEMPGASLKEIQGAIGEAVAAGKLTEYKAKDKQILTLESVGESNTRRLAEKAAYSADRALGDMMQQYDLAATARDRIIERMTKAEQDVKQFTTELANARANRDEKAINAAMGKLKEASQVLTGLSEQGFDRAVRKEVEQVVRERNAASPASTKPEGKDLADKREASLVAYAEKLTANTVNAQRTAGIPVRGQQSLSVTVNADVIEAVRNEALNSGRLHMNAGRLSVETELTTNARLEGNRNAAQEYRSAVSKEKSAEYQASRIEKQAERQTAAIQAKAERFKGMTRAQRERELYPTYSKAVRNTKLVSRAIMNPGWAAKRLAIGTVKSLAVQSLTLGDAALRASAAGVVSLASMAVRGRESVLAQAKGEQMTLGKNLAVTKLSTLGYHQTMTGEVYRMKTNLSNAVLVSGIKLLEGSQLTRTGIGQAMKNELVKGITTKRIDGLEAWSVKGIAAASRALANLGRTETAQSLKDNLSKTIHGLKGLSVEERFGKEFANGALKYREAQENFRLGLLDEKGFRQEHANFAKLVEKGVALNDKTRDQAAKVFDSKMKDIRIEREAFTVAHDLRQKNAQDKSKEATAPDLSRFDKQEKSAYSQFSRADSAYQEKAEALRSALPSADQAVDAIKLQLELKAAILEQREQQALKRLDAVPESAVKQAKERVAELKNGLEQLPKQHEQDRAIASASRISARDFRIMERDAKQEKFAAPKQEIAADKDTRDKSLKLANQNMDSAPSKSKDRSRDVGPSW